MIKNYFTFKGRLNRKPYWIMNLILIAIIIVIMIAASVVLESISLASATGSVFIVLLLIIIPFAIAAFSIMARRLHDRNKSAWWIVIFYFGPSLLMGIGASLGAINSALFVILYGAGLALGIWSFVELGFLKGTDGPNQFGPDPLTGASVNPDVFS